MEKHRVAEHKITAWFKLSPDNDGQFRCACGWSGPIQCWVKHKLSEGSGIIPEMVERGAVALWDRTQKLRQEIANNAGIEHEMRSWAHTAEHERSDFRELSRSHLVAMYEPTEAMTRNLTARNAHCTDDVWRAMIDAALGK
jgi:hypothetical protein